MGLSWRRQGGREKLTGCIISRFHCPGTGVLNQPQVADKRIWIESQQGPLPTAACRHCHCRSWLDIQSLASVGQDLKDWWGRRKPSLPRSLSLTLLLSPLPPSSPMSLPGEQLFWEHRLCMWKGVICFNYNLIHDTGTMDESSRFYLHDRCTESKGSLARQRLFQVSHASKNIINPIMREILMRCALKSDSGVIIRVILPVVESWSWTEACSVAESERKCCYACRSCSHLCLNQ